ncbi:MAG: NAD(P)-dependent oxidoreductase, partial [Parabacteroides sp.]|nr:NAD(P)-dependent oxidoreductase [Parabacteroides sp.]
WAGVRSSSSRAQLQDKRIQFIDLKYGDPKALTEQLSEFVREHGSWDYVIHNAGLTKTLDKKNFYRVNADYTKNLVEALAASGCKLQKFLLMSSLSSYGCGDEKTFRPISLDDPQLPNTEYGKSKLEAENYIRCQSHFPYVILRPTGVYGPGEKDYFVEIRSVKSGFDFTAGFTPQRITFIYVKDLAVVAFLALENEAVVNRHYFVADGDVHTDESFAHIIQDVLGKKFVLRARMPLGLVYIACQCSEWVGRLLNKSMTLNTDKYKILKQRNWICDVEPLKKELGFVPQYPLRKGLEESIAWYKKEGWL